MSQQQQQWRQLQQQQQQQDQEYGRYSSNGSGSISSSSNNNNNNNSKRSGNRTSISTNSTSPIPSAKSGLRRSNMGLGSISETGSPLPPIAQKQRGRISQLRGGGVNGDIATPPLDGFTTSSSSSPILSPAPAARRKISLKQAAQMATATSAMRTGLRGGFDGSSSMDPAASNEPSFLSASQRQRASIPSGMIQSNRSSVYSQHINNNNNNNNTRLSTSSASSKRDPSSLSVMTGVTTATSSSIIPAFPPPVPFSSSIPPRRSSSGAGIPITSRGSISMSSGSPNNNNLSLREGHYRNNHRSGSFIQPNNHYRSNSLHDPTSSSSSMHQRGGGGADSNNNDDNENNNSNNNNNHGVSSSSLSSGSFSQNGTGNREITWLQQFYWTTWKNFVILRRTNKWILGLLLCSSIIAVLASWLTTKQRKAATTLFLEGIGIETSSSSSSSSSTAEGNVNVFGDGSSSGKILLAPFIPGALNDCGALRDGIMDRLLSIIFPNSYNNNYNNDDNNYDASGNVTDTNITTGIGNSQNNNNNNDDNNMFQLYETLNEDWRSGVPVIVLAFFGPTVNALFIFYIVRAEFTSQLVGTLRSLGVRESVYWMSWYFTFAVVAFINSMLGAMICKMIVSVDNNDEDNDQNDDNNNNADFSDIYPKQHGVPIWESVYFGGIFASLWYLQLALQSASFFLVALCGTNSKVVIDFLIFVLIAMTPWIFLAIINKDSDSETFGGLYWNHGDTMRAPPQKTSTAATATTTTTTTTGSGIESLYSVCHEPIISKEEGKQMKTDYDRALMSDDDIFTGCYFNPSSLIRFEREGGLGLPFILPIPYYNFVWIWGNFAGYTSLPNRTFTNDIAKLPTEELAQRSLAMSFPPKPDELGGLSRLAEQQSMFRVTTRIPMPTIVTNPYGDYSSSSAGLLPDTTTTSTTNNTNNDTATWTGFQQTNDNQDIFLTGTCPLPDRPGYNFCGYYNNCDYLTTGKIIEGLPSTKDQYKTLILLSIIYLVLAWYWAQVFPGLNNGRAEKWYFFLQPRYWFGKKKKPTTTTNGRRAANDSSDDSDTTDSNNFDDDDDDDDEFKTDRITTTTSSRRTNNNNNNDDDDSSNGVDQEEGTTNKDTVSICLVSKYYGDFAALDSISLEMKRGEITSLLGHNGAGKTTLVSILACDQNANYGTVHVFGNCIENETHAVRQMVGLCKQEDYFWPDLTAKEHLELYAGLRGVSFEKIDEIVKKWLRSIDLDDDLVQQQFPDQYSGGMRRRLSLALATIGDRPFILLDEPTTGMDPVSRRSAWRHIDEIKQGRVILLTTHAMDEADLLSDKVAVVNRGKLVEFGSPIDLKAQHGTPLQFRLLVAKEDTDSTIRSIKKFFGEKMKFLLLDISTSGNIDIRILSVVNVDEKEGEREEENDDGNSRNNEDGISVELLAEFVAWIDSAESKVLEYSFANSSLEEVFLKLTTNDGDGGSRNVETRPNGGAPVDSLIRRSLIVSGGGLRASSTVSNSISLFQPKLSIWNQTWVLYFDIWKKQWSPWKGAHWNWGFFTTVVLSVNIFGTSLVLPEMDFIVFPWIAAVVVSLAIFLPFMIWPLYKDRFEGRLQLMQSQGLLPDAFVLSFGFYSFSVSTIYTILLMISIMAAPAYLDPNVCEPTLADNYTTVPNCEDIIDFGDRLSVPVTTILNYEDMYNGTSVTLGAYRSPGSYSLLFMVICACCLASSGGVLFAGFLPGHRFVPVIVAIFAFGIALWPLAWSFAEFDYDLCDQRLNLNVCSDISSWNSSHPSFLDCVGFQVNREYMSSYCISPFLGLLPLFGAFQSLAMLFSAEINFVSEPPNYVEEVLMPSIFYNGGSCVDNACSFPAVNRIFWQNIVFMLATSIFMSIIGYLAARLFVFPTDLFLSLRKFTEKHVTNLICCLRKKSINATNKSSQADLVIQTDLHVVEREKDIVMDMVRPFVTEIKSKGKRGTAAAGGGKGKGKGGSRGKKNGGKGEENGVKVSVNYDAIDRDHVAPILLHKLRKVYPGTYKQPPKVALHGLSIHVAKGQVLGLLGENGAGKTTAIKILSGAHNKSGGLGLVAGYDTSVEKSQVSERFGSCAQSDIFWKDQSVKDHLEFFGALKGLPRDQIAEAAKNIATAVGLGSNGIYYRRAGHLSGGMKRRLSIGMALLGAPVVLTFDEPTTGLDPSTRNSIWDLFASFATPERGIIISTHMMMEADALCNRIAILAGGKLKAIGTQQELKQSLGDGFMLQVILVGSSQDHVDRAMRFAESRLHPDVTLRARRAKTLFIDIPRDLKLDRVFRALCSKDRALEGGINHFVLSECPLEAVFLLFGERGWSRS